MAVVGIATGAAKRRRERRLRSWLRHERMTVAMALAEVTHHTAPRGQKTARARGEERDELHDAMGLMAPPSSRPTPLAEVRPQGRVLRHAVEQIVDVVLGLPTLDGPVPLMVEQLVDVLQLFDALIPVCRAGYRCAQDLHRAHPAANLARFVSRSWRKQLVEVPMIVSFSSFQWIVEQTVDIPVPQGGGRHADLQGFLRGQSSTGVEQIVDIPGGGLHRPGQGLPASSSHVPARVHDDADESGEKFFSHFSPSKKKVRSLLRTRSRNYSPSRAHPRRLLSWRVRRVGAAQG